MISFNQKLRIFTKIRLKESSGKQWGNPYGPKTKASDGGTKKKGAKEVCGEKQENSWNAIKKGHEIWM